MFTDLVNSTTLSDQLDPEDFRILIESYRTAAVAPIKRYGGVVARYLGDGMLVYFGYPEAHEDDPDRAVHAGLDIVEATKTLNERWDGEGRGKIAVRIGIHTGIVVVGDVIKEDVQEPMAVFGNPPSLAARLQELASPNSVVLSGATKALLRPTLQCLPRGQTILKGIAKPVEIFVAHGVEGRSVGNRFIDRGRKVLPFVNREKEMAALRLGWESAKKGEGKVFLLTGDPGIGKSRLIRALEDHVTAKPCHWLVARTSPYATNSDFFAFAELFHGLVRPGDPTATDAEGYELLQRVLAEQELGGSNHALGFANLLGIAIPDEAMPQHLRPERLRDVTLAAIAAWFRRKSADQPVALVIEDLHWADASTLEAIKLLISGLASSAVLMVISSRTPDRLGEMRHQVETLTIERLRQNDAKVLLDHIVHDAGLSSASIDTLLERADGVPLYLEELPKPVLDAGRYARPGQDSDPIATLPATLRDSLMAQLDRMGVGKSVAQTGAVLGHSFDDALMRRVYGGSLRQMQEGLATLTEAGLLIRHGSPPEATYVFKHALLAEIAYDSLLRQECRQIHRRTADALVAHFPFLTDTRPELIARHYAAARDAGVAFDYWMKAGKAAARRSANTEAIGHFRSAEAELETLKVAGKMDLDERWLALYKARAPVQIALLGWAADDVERTYRAALELSRKSSFGSHEEFNAWAGLSNVFLLRGQLSKAREATDRLERIVIRHRDRDQLLKWRRALGLCDFLAGRFLQANDNFDIFIGLEKQTDSSGRLASDGLSPLVNAYSIKAWSQWFIGNASQAATISSRSIQIADSLNHPFSLCYALCIAASIAQCQSNYSDALFQAERALELASEHAFTYWNSWASLIKGWAISHLGKSETGLKLLRSGLRQYQDCESTQMRGYALSLLAEACLQANKLNDAIEMVDAAIVEIDRTGIIFYKAETYRLKAEILARIENDGAKSVSYLLRALRFAEQQQALSMSLRTISTLLRFSHQSRLLNPLEKRISRILCKAKKHCDSVELERAKSCLNRETIHSRELKQKNTIHSL